MAKPKTGRKRKPAAAEPDPSDALKGKRKRKRQWHSWVPISFEMVCALNETEVRQAGNHSDPEINLEGIVRLEEQIEDWAQDCGVCYGLEGLSISEIDFLSVETPRRKSKKKRSRLYSFSVEVSFTIQETFDESEVDVFDEELGEIGIGRLRDEFETWLTELEKFEAVDEVSNLEIHWDGTDVFPC